MAYDKTKPPPLLCLLLPPPPPLLLLLCTPTTTTRTTTIYSILQCGMELAEKLKKETNVESLLQIITASGR